MTTGCDNCAGGTPLPEMNGIHVFGELRFPLERYADALTGWGDSFINMPQEISFLAPGKLGELCDYCGLDGDVRNYLLETAETIVHDRCLNAYAWHVFYRLKTPSFSYGASPAGFSSWPLPEHSLGKRAHALFLLCSLGAVEASVPKYREEGYPEKIIKDTFSVVRSSCDSFVRQTGAPGSWPAALSWMRLYLTARLVQLGRFNYKLMETIPFGVALRNRRDGRKVLLSRVGDAYNSAGWCLQKDDPLAEGGWTADYRETETTFSGCAISPCGFALPGTRSYPRDEWEAVLRPGDVMIDMHIPAGGRMTPEACRDSFRQAFDFFGAKHGGKFKKVIISHSWIFNTQFEGLLPESNLAKLMRECYLFPFVSSGRDGMFFLFGEKCDGDPALLPHGTSVERAMLGVLEAGNRLRCGGMLYFAEDLERFGTSVYRNSFAEGTMVQS